MTLAQQNFLFPIRLYDSVEVEQDERTEDLTNSVSRYIRPYVIGWKRLPIESIREWNSSFTKGKTLEEVERDGLDITVVDTYDGYTYVCDWDLERFEKEYNKHYRKLDKHMRKLNEEVEQESNIVELSGLKQNQIKKDE
jgi:hypothetical protein